MANPTYIPFGRRPILAGGVVHQKHKLDGIRVINSTGSDIATQKLVAIVGYNTTAELPKIVLADANNPAHRDIYVTLQEIDNGDEGIVFKGALSSADLNTNSATTAGDPVYLSETAGGFAHTAPSTGGAAVIPVGWVVTKSSTVGEIHWHIGDVQNTGISGGGSPEIVAATNVITAAENNATFFLAAATEFVSTLPAPFLGAHYTFIVTAAPSGASYTVVTDAAAQILAGQVMVCADAAGDAEAAATGTTITFVDGQAVVGDMAEVWSDGTSWFAVCHAQVAAGITITG